MPAIKAIQMKVEGLTELLRQFQGEPVYARAWRRALGRIAMDVKRAARAKAPVLSGRTQRGVYYRMPRVPIPLWAIVSDRAKRKGYRYPFVLEAGHRKMSYGDVQLHFRGTGRSTKGWFSSIRNEVQGHINQALDTAVDQIRAKWEGREVG